jgi:uncharacterized protein (DUF2342 family)
MKKIDYSLLERAGRKLDRDGEPPDDGGMDERIKNLETFADEARGELRAIDGRLTKIDARLDHMATKADLAEAMNGQIKWIVGTAIVLGSMGITIMTFVLNNAVPKAPSSTAQPLVIYAPPALQAPAAPPAK